MKKRNSLGLTLAPLPALPTLLRSTDVKRLLPDKVRPSSDAYLTFKKKCFYCIKKTMYVVIVIVSVSVSVCVCVCVCVCLVRSTDVKRLLPAKVPPRSDAYLT